MADARCLDATPAPIARASLHPGPRHGPGRRVPAVRLPPRATRHRSAAGCATAPTASRSTSRERPRHRVLPRELERSPPPAADIASIETEDRAPLGAAAFEIEASGEGQQPTVRISPDLPVCAACLAEMRGPARPPARLPLRQLHRLRPALHHRSRSALRPAAHHHARVRDVRALRPRVRGPARSPLPRAAHGLPRSAARPTSCSRTGARRRAAAPRSQAAVGAALRPASVLAVKGIGGYHLAADARRASRSARCGSARAGARSRSP